jgi:hypothetical protein
VRVATTKAGAVRFKLWTKIGNEPMQSHVIDAWSKFVGPGKFEASFLKPLPVSKTTSVQAMVEELNNPIGLTTGWKSVTVRCTGAGGGGFASTPRQSDAGTHQAAAPAGTSIKGVLTARPQAGKRLPQTPPRGGQIKTAPKPGSAATAAKARFPRWKPL